MAFTVSELMTDVRYKIIMPHTDDLDNTELLVYVNQMNRELYRQASMHCPQVIWTDDDTGSTVASTATLTTNSSVKVMRWVVVQVDEVNLKVVNPRDIYDFSGEGQPVSFWPSGFTQVRLYPIPDAVYDYRLIYIAEPTALESTSTFAWPYDFYDLLLDGVSMVAKIRNGWDMRGEAEFFKEWRQEAISRLTSLTYENEYSATRGYWGASIPLVKEDY